MPFSRVDRFIFETQIFLWPESFSFEKETTQKKEEERLYMEWKRERHIVFIGINNTVWVFWWRTQRQRANLRNIANYKPCCNPRNNT